MFIFLKHCLLFNLKDISCQKTPYIRINFKSLKFHIFSILNTIFEEFLKQQKVFCSFFGLNLKLEELRGQTTLRVVFYKFDLFIFSFELLK